ncbi:MAG: hypothetical protein ACO3NQ_06345 [Ilumatobacteraceae bacterium]
MARKPGHPAPQKNATVTLTPDESDRYRQVVDLKRLGWTFDEIAEYVGYADRSGAKRAYDAALKRWGTAAVDEVRASEGERIDQLWRRVSTAIAQLGTDADPNQLATLTNSAIRISGARRQLFGMDAPRQVELTGQDGGPLRTDVGEILRERLRQLEA